MIVNFHGTRLLWILETMINKCIQENYNHQPILEKDQVFQFKTELKIGRIDRLN
jgi:hypothetical protein